MKKLKNLIFGIQEAISETTSMVQKKNLELLDFYFDKVEQDESHQSIKAILSATIDEENPEKKEKIISSLLKSLTKEDLGINSGDLIPKMVNLKYPQLTANGAKSHNVSTPLLSLIPIEQCTLSKAIIKMDLDFSLTEDDELRVSFPLGDKTLKTSKNDVNNVTQKSYNTSIELILDKDTNSDGIDSILEGYNKAIRAQLPT